MPRGTRAAGGPLRGSVQYREGAGTGQSRERRATWFQLTRPDPLSHYAELRKLLIQHAEHLANEIDARTEPCQCQQL